MKVSTCLIKEDILSRVCWCSIHLRHELLTSIKVIINTFACLCQTASLVLFDLLYKFSQSNEKLAWLSIIDYLDEEPRDVMGRLTGITSPRETSWLLPRSQNFKQHGLNLKIKFFTIVHDTWNLPWLCSCETHCHCFIHIHRCSKCHHSKYKI